MWFFQVPQLQKGRKCLLHHGSLSPSPSCTCFSCQMTAHRAVPPGELEGGCVHSLLSCSKFMLNKEWKMPQGNFLSLYVKTSLDSYDTPNVTGNKTTGGAVDPALAASLLPAWRRRCWGPNAMTQGNISLNSFLTQQRAHALWLSESRVTPLLSLCQTLWLEQEDNVLRAFYFNTPKTHLQSASPLPCGILGDPS